MLEETLNKAEIELLQKIVRQVPLSGNIETLPKTLEIMASILHKLDLQLLNAEEQIRYN